MTITPEELKTMRDFWWPIKNKPFPDTVQEALIRCLDEIDRLQKSLNDHDLAFQATEERVNSQQDLLKKAEEMAKFYADPHNFEHDDNPEFQTGGIGSVAFGETARAFLSDLKKYREGRG